MIRGLRRNACIPGIGLSLLMLMAGCGGGGGVGGTSTPPSNNPVPAITSLSPSFATAGAAAQTLTINGTNFLSTSTVTYNAVGHATTFVSATQLTISLSAGDQATAGNYPVVVTNPAPGGGASTAVNFTVNNPAPTITSLSPSSAAAGAAAQTLTINGTNFLSTSTVTYNAVGHAATFVSATKLTISLSVGDQATAGNYPVVVTNPAPGGGASTAVNFTVNNPAPGITSLSPSSVTAGAAAQTLTINGTNFLSTSTVTYNAVGHAATFVSATKLTISLSVGDQATAGNYPVVVTNPAPGGGASNAVNFTVNAATPTVSLSITTPGSSAASVPLGGTQPIVVSITGTSNTLVNWTVGGIAGGNPAVGTITGSYPNFTYNAPAAIPPGNPLTATATSQADTSQSASVTLTLTQVASQANAVLAEGNSTHTNGINFNLTSAATTLALVSVGTCPGTPANPGTCRGGASGIQVVQGATVTVWLIGQGLTDSAGANLASGLTVKVSQGSTSDVTVSSPTAQCNTTGDPTCTPSAPALTNITFQIQVSASAAPGQRNIIVTNGASELQAYVGAILITGP